MNNCFSENMCSRVFRCARSSAGVPQRTLHNSHMSVCGCVDLKEGEEDLKEKREEEKREGKKRGEKEREARKRERRREGGRRNKDTSLRGTGKAKDKLTWMPSCVVPSSSPGGGGLVLSAAGQYARPRLPPLCARGTLEWARLPSHLRRAGHPRGRPGSSPVLCTGMGALTHAGLG